MRYWKMVFGAGAVAVATPLAFLVVQQSIKAADHLDPPARTDPSMDSTPDRPADIADLYSWHTDTSVIIALTFAGPQATTAAATYDRDVLYTVNISNSSPRTTSNIPIEIRFGDDNRKAGDNFGVQVKGLPGVAGGTISGPVETDLRSDGVIVRAGLFDDPFFFDLQGFRTTAMTGTLSFDKTRDFFKGQNLTAVVIEIPKERIANGTNPVDVWATTARLGGQL